MNVLLTTGLDISQVTSSIDITHNVVCKETAAAAYESVRARARARESVSE